MFAPSRLLYSLRPTVSPGVLAAAMAVATTFVATPFLLQELVRSFGVSLGVAGLVSTVQVGGFAVVTLVAGRLGRSSLTSMRSGLALFVAANLASAFAPWFLVLLGLRLVAGGAAGLITWMVWADAAGDARRTADVSAIGPIGAIMGAPLFGWLIGVGRDNAVFLTMAVVAVVPLLLPLRMAQPMGAGRGRRVSSSRSNRVLLGALALATLAGSSFFIYIAAAADDLSGISPAAASWAYSLNASGGLVGARVSRRNGPAWPWAGVIGGSIVVILLVASPLVFYAAMALWGFAFWMMLPRVLRLLAARSYAPAERIGDAHAGMAAGRALGPAVGAPFATSGHYVALGAVAAAGTAVAASAIGFVERFRRKGGDRDVRPVDPTG